MQMCVRVRVMPMTSIRDEFQTDLNQSTCVLHCSNSEYPLLFVWLFLPFQPSLYASTTEHARSAWNARKAYAITRKSAQCAKTARRRWRVSTTSQRPSAKCAISVSTTTFAVSADSATAPQYVSTTAIARCARHAGVARSASTTVSAAAVLIVVDLVSANIVVSNARFAPSPLARGGGGASVKPLRRCLPSASSRGPYGR